MMKTHSRVVGPMSEELLKHPRTLRTGSRSANKIKKVCHKLHSANNSTNTCTIPMVLDVSESP